MAADAETNATADLERLPETPHALETLLWRLGASAPAADLVTAMRAEWPWLREQTCIRQLVTVCADLSSSVATDDGGRTYVLRAAKATPQPAYLPAETAPREPVQTAPAVTRGWPVLGVSEILALPEPEWLVDGMIPAGGRLVSLSGLTNTGKSFLTLDLCLSLATGSEWFGRPTVGPCPVLYLALEGPYDLKPRIHAWQTANLAAVADLGRFRAPAVEALDLTRPGELEALEETVRAESARLVVIDTLSVALGDRDENSASDLRPVLAGLRTIVKRTQSTVVLVQHTPWDGKRERGSNAIRSEMDATLHVQESDSPGVVYLTNPKQRSARRFETEAWRLSDVAGTASAIVVRESLPGRESVEARILAALEPGEASRSALYRHVAGNRAAFDAALERLEKVGAIVKREQGQRHLYAAVTGSGHGLEP